MQRRQSTEISARLEAECDLQIEAAIKGARTEGPARERVALSKNRRADHADRIARVHVVKNISAGHGKREAVFLAGTVSAKAATPARSAAAAARATRSATKGSAAQSAARGRARGFRFFAESDGFAQAQIKSESSRPRGAIDGDERVRARFVAFETGVLRNAPFGLRGRERLRESAKRWPVVENGIFVRILAAGDVEGRTRTRNHEGTEPELFRQGNAAAEKDAVANIKRGAAVILRDVELIGGKTSGAGGIAVGVIQGVVAEEGNFLSDANAAVHDELVLFENSRAFVLVNIVGAAEGPAGVVKRRSLRRVDIAGEQSVNAARIQIGDGDVRAF